MILIIWIKKMIILYLIMKWKKINCFFNKENTIDKFDEIRKNHL